MKSKYNDINRVKVNCWKCLADLNVINGHYVSCPYCGIGFRVETFDDVTIDKWQPSESESTKHI